MSRQLRSQTNASPLFTVGLDLGDRFSRFCVLDADGTLIEEGRVASTEAALRRRFSGSERMRIVLETGTHSPWTSRLLEHLGHEIIVANARRLRLIYAVETKNDKIDAESLARVGRMDPALLAPIQHRGESAQADLAVLRARDALVRTRTLLVNHVRGAVKSIGGRVPKCSTPAFARKVRDAIPESLQPALTSVLDLIERLGNEIAAYDRKIEALAAERYRETETIASVHGVGTLTALCYVLTLEDPERFKSSRAVGSYLGLRPKQADSGQSSPSLRITKTGDRMLRRLLVGSAQYILGPFGQDSDLRRWGMSLMERGGKNAKKRAVVAVARKLAVLLHRLWITGQRYEPLRLARLCDRVALA